MQSLKCVLSNHAIWRFVVSPNEIIFLIIAIAIVVLIIFIIRFLLKLDVTFTKLNSVIDQTDHISEDLNDKMQCINPFFQIASHVGEGLKHRAVSYERDQLIESLKEQLNQSESDKSDIYLDAIDCALLGLKIWKQLKNKK